MTSERCQHSVAPAWLCQGSAATSTVGFGGQMNSHTVVPAGKIQGPAGEGSGRGCVFGLRAKGITFHCRRRKRRGAAQTWAQPTRERAINSQHVV